VITVGIPTYNRAHQLRNAIQHVLDQSFEYFELRVFDDGSTDGTEEVVRSFDDPRLSYFRDERNRGIPAVVNRILSAARGDAIVILHDHDQFHKDLLTSMIEVLEAHPSVGVVNPGVAWVNEDGSGYHEMPRLEAPVLGGRAVVERMLLGPDFACPITACALVRRQAYESVGCYYRERYGFLSDVDMWLRLSAQWDVGQVQETHLVCMRRGAGHEFAVPDWRLVSWSTAIHEDAICRVFGEDHQALDAARTVLERKALRLSIRTLLDAVALGHTDLVSEGLARLSEHSNPPVRALARALSPAPTLLARPGPALANAYRAGRRMRGVARRRASSKGA
jgi:glycosyltransferase involved in cell wall biosynthesis